MPPAPTSNIRAFVQWRDPSVYAGEDIECIITFRNIARTLEQLQDEPASTPLANGHARKPSHVPSAAGSRRASIAQTRPAPQRAPSVTTSRGGLAGRGHRPTLSLNVVSAPSRAGLHSAPSQSKTPQSASQPTKSHARSLSIMSLGGEALGDSQPQSAGLAHAKRPGRGHGRSASMQMTPKSAPPYGPAGLGIGAPRQPSPLYESTTPPASAEARAPIRPRTRPGTMSADTTPQLNNRDASRRSPRPAGLDSEFRFPAQPSRHSPPMPPRSPSSLHSAQHRAGSPRPPDGWSGTLSNLNPITRVMSESSTMSNTPRNSGELDSRSNHSDETLTSEMPLHQQQNGRLLPTQIQPRQNARSRQSSYTKTAEPETLMMGYAQTMGTFTLDGSLVNAAPFEEVKRKGVQSGGGVVGIERSKRSSGMFGAFSWGNIGESLGGLLGGDDMSSMAQMKATVGSRSVPLLSTPQSLLFVDLRLAPGESRSYHYRFALPRGLPPSFRGRAIKVAYHISLGIQRPGGQMVKTIDVPFRVLGSYNARGETLGHDLMSPYILLQDAARTMNISPDASSMSPTPPFPAKEQQKTPKTPKQGLEDFLRYTERLLEEPRDANGALLSPTSPHASPSLSRHGSIVEQAPVSIKEAVDFAILRSNYVAASGKQRAEEASSTNRFNIARSGQPVAVLTLLRPVYRLGEAVLGTIDSTSPAPTTTEMPPPANTYAVLIELEAAERVDPSLALRSSSSINRVTRKVHASAHENTLFARQISFSLTIPASATPSFETTGVSLAWKLRIEFTTSRQSVQDAEEGDGNDNGLLEDLGTDERGTVSIAKEMLLAETFEIAVPLKVYGAPGVDSAVGEVEALEV